MQVPQQVTSCMYSAAFHPSLCCTLLPAASAYACLQTALREGVKQMDFMGKSVEVNFNAGLFVTLNPAGKGYGGRSKLPDNLQQMFRYGVAAALVTFAARRIHVHGQESRTALTPFP